jgi:hypothetical protein
MSYPTKAGRATKDLCFSASSHAARISECCHAVSTVEHHHHGVAPRCFTLHTYNLYGQDSLETNLWEPEAKHGTNEGGEEEVE